MAQPFEALQAQGAASESLCFALALGYNQSGHFA
jgi:hypothetical protein